MYHQKIYRLIFTIERTNVMGMYHSVTSSVKPPFASFKLRHLRRLISSLFPGTPPFACSDNGGARASQEKQRQCEAISVLQHSSNSFSAVSSAAASARGPADV